MNLENAPSMHLDRYDRLYLAAGKLILRWAAIDDALDSGIRRIHWEIESIAEGERPNRFRDRLALFRRLILQYSDNPQVRREINKIAGTIHRLKKVRDAMAHGSVMPEFDNSPFIYLGREKAWPMGDPEKQGRMPYHGVFGPRISLERLEEDISHLAIFPARIVGVWGNTVREWRMSHPRQPFPIPKERSVDN